MLFPSEGPKDKLQHEQQTSTAALVELQPEIQELVLNKLFIYDLVSASFKNLTTEIDFSRFWT